MLMYSELQHALLHVFRDKVFQSRLAELRKPIELPADASEKDWLKAAGKQWKQVHEHVQHAQIPILERFGFPKNLKGAMMMENYLINKYADPRTTAEMRERGHELERLVKGVSRHDTFEQTQPVSDQLAHDNSSKSHPPVIGLPAPQLADKILHG